MSNFQYVVAQIGIAMFAILPLAILSFMGLWKKLGVMLLIYIVCYVAVVTLPDVTQLASAAIPLTWLAFGILVLFERRSRIKKAEKEYFLAKNEVENERKGVAEMAGALTTKEEQV
jgi:hypothetical protein